MYESYSCSNTCKNMYQSINYILGTYKKKTGKYYNMVYFFCSFFYEKPCSRNQKSQATLRYIRQAHTTAVTHFWTSVKIFFCICTIIPYETSYCCVAFETFHRHIFMATQFLFLSY